LASRRGRRAPPHLGRSPLIIVIIIIIIIINIIMVFVAAQLAI